VRPSDALKKNYKMNPEMKLTGNQSLTTPSNGVSIFDNGKGSVSIIKNGKEIAGGISYEVNGNKIQIKRSDVKESGKGTGTEAYKQFIDQKLAQGFEAGSDADVTVAAQKIYEKLKAMGYDVQESPNSKVGYEYKKSTLSKEDRTKQRQEAWKKDKSTSFNPDGEPVYTVKGKKK